VSISNQPISTIENFIEDQGITFPVLHDINNVRGLYNIPGSQSPYPRDFIIDADGVVRLAKTEYDPAAMLHVLEILLDGENKIDIELIPEKFHLFNPYPNPFNPSSNIRFELNSQETMSLKIFDSNGRLIKSFAKHLFDSGLNSIEWNASNHPSGIYFVYLTDGITTQSKKLILLK